MSEESTGLWLIGARGSLATTLIVGARAIARGLVSSTGLASETPGLADLGLVSLERIRFGGHEIRGGTLRESAAEISRQNGSIRADWISRTEDDLRAVDREIRIGSAVGCGDAIERFDGGGSAESAPARPRELVARWMDELRSFRESQNVRRLIVVNLASTEPPTEWNSHYQDLDALERRLDEPGYTGLRAGLLYAYAAFSAGAAYLNFTPSNSALCPATEALAAREGLAYMGNDGKTGETLVKSALAPMFKYRNLRVLSWIGYNLLGNRDGEVLNQSENKLSKVGSKDAVLGSILGYPLRTQVGIDYVESLADSKVAWDFIHFEGFLEHRMSMQFVWQGCDSVLAAPVVLDLARLLDHAMQVGEPGAQRHLAAFFKSPLHGQEHDLHRQFHLLTDYVQRHGGRH